MFKLIVALASFAIISVHGAPQLNDVELKEQAFNRINEAEYDYKFSLSDGHEQEQLRKEVDGAHVVIGFYKYIDPDGKERQIYYKADKRGYQVSYDKPFELPNESERLTDLSRTYLPPSQNLIQDVLNNNAAPNNEYLPPARSRAPSQSYLPPN